MASSAGNSSGSAGDLRKRKRMESNRESARRSRQRKQKHVDDLTAQIEQLRKVNGQISSSVEVTAQQCASVEAENCVLNAQMTELSERLQSLNEIVNFINAGGGGWPFEAEEFDGGLSSVNMWNAGGMGQLHQPQPIMARDV